MPIIAFGSPARHNAGAGFVAELVDTFTDEAPQMLAELRESFAAAAAERFRRAAHSVRSHSSTFGASRLAEMARCIEPGADDCLHRPVNPVPLQARVGASLQKKRLHDQQKALVRRFAASAVAQDLQPEACRSCVRRGEFRTNARRLAALSRTARPGTVAPR